MAHTPPKDIAPDGGKSTTHWWMQRLTSVALIPLVIWCAYSVALLPNLSHYQVTFWVSQPLTAILLIALLLSLCYHMTLGLHVILEDYIHTASVRIPAIALINFASIFIALSGIYAIIKITFVAA